MKIMFVANTSWSMYNFRIDVIKQLLQDKHDVYIFAPYDDTTQKLCSIGCRVIDINIDAHGINPFKDGVLIYNFYNTYKRIKPHIVFHYTIKPVIYGSFVTRILSIPTVNMITGMGKVFLSESWLKRFVIFLYKISQKKARTVIFLNKNNEQTFLDNHIVKKDQVLLIPGEGINFETFPFLPYPNSTKEVIFLLIARLLPEKGIKEFIEAAGLVKIDFSYARFMLLGDVSSDISQSDIQRWDTQNCVEYLGFHNDVQSYIRQAHCIVLPTYYGEGVPRSLMEGCAMGRPIITTDISGCKELVEDGVSGYVCEIKSVMSLAEKMKNMLQKSMIQRKEMGKNSYNLVLRTYSVSRIIGIYKEIIHSIEETSL